MASSSTQKSFKYVVFLSFRGEDTRKTFVDHLYHALENKGIETYKDDEKIKQGKTISDELIEAIENSKFYIIVFSKNYASSSWCLEELVKIMECRKGFGHTAYPVFYDVEPTEVRNQSGAVGDAFAKHEEEEAAWKWREALKEAADLAGMELKNTLDGHEAKFIQKIVQEISLDLRFINSSVDRKLVGMERRTRNVVSFFETGVYDVYMIGIKGMGGSGKTTLARAVFDQISFQFEGQSFVENVREVSRSSLYGVQCLQKQVLSDISKDPRIKVSNVYDGQNMIQKMMRVRKVLIVLDDVDDIEQLDALAGDRNWFKPGSIIIITTRDEQVLIQQRVNSICDVTLLSDKEAICLFSRYAFGRETPIQGYKELSKQVVRYAAGLPLTIKVLGSLMCGKNDAEWIDALKRLKKIPLKKTMEKLEISYISLEDDYKEIFLDVACILKGERKDIAIRALESCGFHARNGLKVLEQKSLISISKYGYLRMHDHIEEMGKSIVRRSHPLEPNKHSHLWIDEEIEDVLINNLGTKATRCIKMSGEKYDLEAFMRGLGNMKKLRFLSICHSFYENVNEAKKHFPNSIQYLSWHHCPFESLPKTFQAKYLVGLNMEHSKIVQLWEGGERKILYKLRFLDLRYSKLRTFDGGLTPNLETLNLEDCYDLVELHMSGGCPMLNSLDLSHAKLRTLDLGSTLTLEKLRILHCYHLTELYLPNGWSKLKSLKLIGLKVRTLELGPAPNLENFHIEYCQDLEELHLRDRCRVLKSLDIILFNLRTLDLGSTLTLEKLRILRCYHLTELYLPNGWSKLKSLKLIGLKVRTLELGPAPNLENFHIEYCEDLEELHLRDRCRVLKSLDIVFLNLRTLDLGSTLTLEKLRILRCYHLTELYLPNGWSKLKSLKLIGLKVRTLELGPAPNLENFHIEYCQDLEELHLPDGCPMLTSLDINGVKLRTLDLRSTLTLKTLRIQCCFDLTELYLPRGCSKLKFLRLSNLKVRTLELGLTPNLEYFQIEYCQDLEGLHMLNGCTMLTLLDINGVKLRTLDLRSTLTLGTLRIRNCFYLTELYLPDGCPKLKSLKLNNLKVRTLELGLTPNLEYFQIEYCQDLEGLHMLNGCTMLTLLDINGVKLRTLDLRSTLTLET